MGDLMAHSIFIQASFGWTGFNLSLCFKYDKNMCLRVVQKYYKFKNNNMK